MPFVSIKKVKNKKPKSPKKNSLPKIRVSGTNEKQLRSAIDHLFVSNPVSLRSRDSFDINRETKLHKPSYSPVVINQETAKTFYQTSEWICLRNKILKKYGKQCMACWQKKDESPPCVDHIKPVRKYWHLRLDPDNLQVLCADCNRAKGNWDETDFRKNRKKSGKRNRRECFKDSRLTSSLVREYSL
jgi:5-methylcytosine-specific restriction protein A